MANFFFFDFYSGPRHDSGQLYTDSNGNGKFDEGEPVQGEAKVKVKAKDGKEYDVTTDKDGKWEVMTSKGWLGVKFLSWLPGCYWGRFT